MHGTSPLMSSTVDSTPTSQFPPSKISGMRPSMSSMTCLAAVGLGLPLRLALGAATGTLHAFNSAAATGCEGIRTATVGRDAVTTSGICGLRGMSSVNGPGQKASINFSASGGTSQMPPADPGSIHARSEDYLQGRPFAAKILRTASLSKAFAPRP